MANPLQPNTMPPPAPVQPNAIGTPQGQQSQQAAPNVPTPTHAQTVAALRHFTALKQELTVLINNPDLGKADMKSAIIDGVTKLVADRIVPPATAVQQLATVPDSPFQQKKWIEQNYAQVMKAENGILAHHGAAFAGQGNQPPPDPANHMQDLQSMMASHYSGAPNA